jgi:hypothetical protein
LPALLILAENIITAYLPSNLTKKCNAQNIH